MKQNFFLIKNIFMNSATAGETTGYVWKSLLL